MTLTKHAGGRPSKATKAPIQIGGTYYVRVGKRIAPVRIAQEYSEVPLYGKQPNQWVAHTLDTGRMVIVKTRALRDAP